MLGYLCAYNKVESLRIDHYIFFQVELCNIKSSQTAHIQSHVRVVKAFDRDGGRVQGCPHSGFDDPDCPDGVPPRSSVEIRAYVFF